MLSGNSKSIASAVLISILTAGSANAQKVSGTDGGGFVPDPPSLAPIGGKGDPSNNSIPGVSKSDPGYAAATTQRMTEAEEASLHTLKDSLGFSDNEWTLIEMKIKLVQILASVSGTSNIPRPIAIKSASANPLVPDCVSRVRAAEQELVKVITDKNTAPELMRAKLGALRETRAQVREQLAKARQELTALLTVRQEAILVQRGLLD